MNGTWSRIAPVAASIVIIILIALLRAWSKTLAAITATMPINIVLALWIVYTAEGGDPAGVAQFATSMLRGVGATVVFLGAVWLAARAGWGLVPMLVAGYLTWAGTLALIFGLERLLGR
jgi:hypothetical protein